MPAKRKPDDNLNDNDAPSSKASKTDDSSNLNAAAQATEQPLSFLSFLQKFGLNGLSTLSKNLPLTTTNDLSRALGKYKFVSVSPDQERIETPSKEILIDEKYKSIFFNMPYSVRLPYLQKARPTPNQPIDYKEAVVLVIDTYKNHHYFNLLKLITMGSDEKIQQELEKRISKDNIKNDFLNLQQFFIGTPTPPHATYNLLQWMVLHKRTKSLQFIWDKIKYVLDGGKSFDMYWDKSLHQKVATKIQLSIMLHHPFKNFKKHISDIADDKIQFDEIAHVACQYGNITVIQQLIDHIKDQKTFVATNNGQETYYSDKDMLVSLLVKTGEYGFNKLTEQVLNSCMSELPFKDNRTTYYQFVAQLIETSNIKMLVRAIKKLALKTTEPQDDFGYSFTRENKSTSLREIAAKSPNILIFINKAVSNTAVLTDQDFLALCCAGTVTEETLTQIKPSAWTATNKEGETALLLLQRSGKEQLIYEHFEEIVPYANFFQCDSQNNPLLLYCFKTALSSHPIERPLFLIKLLDKLMKERNAINYQQTALLLELLSNPKLPTSWYDHLIERSSLFTRKELLFSLNQIRDFPEDRIYKIISKEILEKELFRLSINGKNIFYYILKTKDNELINHALSLTSNDTLQSFLTCALEHKDLEITLHLYDELINLLNALPPSQKAKNSLQWKANYLPYENIIPPALILAFQKDSVALLNKVKTILGKLGTTPIIDKLIGDFFYMFYCDMPSSEETKIPEAILQTLLDNNKAFSKLIQREIFRFLNKTIEMQAKPPVLDKLLSLFREDIRRAYSGEIILPETIKYLSKMDANATVKELWQIISDNYKGRNDIIIDNFSFIAQNKPYWLLEHFLLKAQNSLSLLRFASSYHPNDIKWQFRVMQCLVIYLMNTPNLLLLSYDSIHYIRKFNAFLKLMHPRPSEIVESSVLRLFNNILSVCFKLNLGLPGIHIFRDLIPNPTFQTIAQANIQKLSEFFSCLDSEERLTETNNLPFFRVVEPTTGHIISVYSYYLIQQIVEKKAGSPSSNLLKKIALSAEPELSLAVAKIGDTNLIAYLEQKGFDPFQLSPYFSFYYTFTDSSQQRQVAAQPSKIRSSDTRIELEEIRQIGALAKPRTIDRIPTSGREISLIESTFPISPIIYWVTNAHLPKYEGLVKTYCSANPQKSIQPFGYSAITLLHVAAYFGHFTLANWLIKTCHLNPQQATKDGRLPFEYRALALKGNSYTDSPENRREFMMTHLRLVAQNRLTLSDSLQTRVGEILKRYSNKEELAFFIEKEKANLREKPLQAFLEEEAKPFLQFMATQGEPRNILTTSSQTPSANILPSPPSRNGTFPFFLSPPGRGNAGGSVRNLNNNNNNNNKRRRD